MRILTRIVVVLAIMIMLVTNGLAATYQWQLARAEDTLHGEWYLRHLVSAKGEEERYADNVSPDTLGLQISKEEERLSDHAVIVRVRILNNGDTIRFLKSSFALRVPSEGYEWWNGYANKVPIQFDPEDVSLSQWFPANAVLGKNVGISLGLDPLEVYSRVDTGYSVTAGKLSLEVPIVLNPGEARTTSFVVTTFPTRFGYREVVQNYYDLFPDAYRPAKGIHPSVISNQSTYLYWNPKNYLVQHPDDMIRRITGNQGGWEWCYSPFVRGGDWAISDEYSVGFKKYDVARVEQARENSRKRLERASALNVAPMWYVNVLWSEKTLMENHFPEAMSNPRVRRSWGNDAIFGLYPWANRYGELFVRSILEIPKSFPATRGIGWDSAFGHTRVDEQVAGVLETEWRSYDKGHQFVLNGVGYTPLLDLNHSLESEGYRLANAINLKLVSPYFLGVRADSALYEGNPVEDPRRFIRYEIMRANLGSPKVLSWHKHLQPHRISWVDWDSMEPVQIRDAWRQLFQDTIFLSYFWGAIPSPGMPALGVPYVFEQIPTLIELARKGWQPVAAVEGPKELLYARYGDNTTGAVIAVINPEFETKEARIQFPEESWRKHQLLLVRRDGELLTTHITQGGTEAIMKVPARSVVLVEVVGALESDRFGYEPDVVTSKVVKDATGGVRYDFRVETYEIRKWQVQWQPENQGLFTEVKVGRDLQKFDSDSSIVFTVDSSVWPDDVQSMNIRHGKFSVYKQPRVETLVSVEQLQQTPWFASQGGGTRLIFTGVSEAQAKTFRDTMDRWFLMYTSNVLGTEEKPTEENASDMPVSLVIRCEPLTDSSALAQIRNEQGKVILQGNSEQALEEALFLFLSQMDRAFPYYGSVYLKGDEVLDRADVVGKVLTPEMESDYILKPTLSERWQSHFTPYFK